MFRREWHQQALILVLLTTAVATGIAGVSAVYNTVGVSETAEFGQARQILAWSDVDPAGLADDLAAVERQVGAGNAELISGWSRGVPGAVDPVEYRAQDPAGPLGGPTLALLDGDYPEAADEVAVTDGVAELAQIDIGDMLALDGTERTVVGRVENPGDLGLEFALVWPGGEAAGHTRVESATLLLRTDESTMNDVLTSRFAERVVDIKVREGDERALAAATVVGALAVVLVLVGLLSTAGFVVLAQRRQRQFGMLAAVGAPERLVGLATLVHGLLVGLVAASVGAALGLGGWLAAAPPMERAVRHRIDTFHLPWGLLALAAGLAVVAATAAAWLPARAVARTPVTEALSGRPPTPRAVHRSGLIAAALLAAGIAALVASTPRSMVLAAVGTVACVAGVLAISPLALRVLAATARWLPVGLRLAFRDLGRYQARSGAALAAVGLAVGIPAGVVVTSAAAENREALGNLATDQLLIWTRNADDPPGYSAFYTEDPHDSGFAPFLPDLTAAQLADRARQADRIAEVLDGAAVIPLDVAADPDLADPRGQVAVSLARHVGDGPTGAGWLDIALVYVATPGVLDQYGSETRRGADGVATYTTERGPVALANIEEGTEEVQAPVRLKPGYSSLPGTFISEAELERRGWEAATVGWLIDADHAIGADELARARGLAAGSDLLVEARAQQASLRDLRSWATGIAAALALGIVAATVGLLRSDAAHDLRALTATGASPGIRRTITAATAGGLALLGVVLGTLGAYITLVTGYRDQIGSLSPAPLGHLLLLLVGIPGLAAGVGWLVAGRTQRGIARAAIE